MFSKSRILLDCVASVHWRNVINSCCLWLSLQFLDKATDFAKDQYVKHQTGGDQQGGDTQQGGGGGMAGMIQLPAGAHVLLTFGAVMQAKKCAFVSASSLGS